MTKGEALYADVWDIKPPLGHEIAAVLALLTGGDQQVMCVLGQGITILAGVGMGILVTLIAYELTESLELSVAGGVIPFSVVWTFVLIWRGYNVKYLAGFAVVAALYLHLRDRPMSAMVAAIASAGLWQANVIVPLVLAIREWQRGGYARFRLAGVAGAGTSAVILAPIIAMGALDEMFVQLIYPSIVATEGQTAAMRFTEVISRLGYTTLALCLGLAGYISWAKVEFKERWWLPILAGWYFMFVTFADLDGYDDLIHPLLFIGLGLALFGTRLSREEQICIGLIALLLFPSGIFWQIGVPTPNGDRPLPGRTEIGSVRHELGLIHSPPNYEQPEPGIREMYWKGTILERCHYRMSRVEHQWLEKTSHTLNETTCG